MINNISAMQDNGDLVFINHANEEIARFTDAKAFDAKTLKQNGTAVQDIIDGGTMDLSALTVGHVFHVDNGRTDDYTPNGSREFPYKSIQAAHDAVPAGTTASNIYIIEVKLGLPYTGNISLTKDFITIVGDGGITGAGYSGTITSTSKHLALVDLNLTTSSTINQTGAGHFLLEFKDCHLGGHLNATANGTTAEKQDSYIQVTGDDNLWMNCTINITGIQGFAGMTGGAYVGNDLTVTDSYFCPGCSCVDSCTVNLEAGTTAEFFSMYAIRNTVNLKTGATLYADITALADMDNTLTNTGGTLIRASDKPTLQAIAKAEIYVANSSDAISIPAGSTYTKITSFTTNGYSENCTANATNGQIVITEAGYYWIAANFSTKLGTTDVLADTAVFINDVEQPNIHSRRRFSTAGYTFAVSFDGFTTAALAVNDVVDIRAKHNNASAVSATLEYGNLKVMRVGI